MVHYKLSYFDLPGLSEPIRFMLLSGGLSHEVNLISPEGWPEVKNKYPFGKLPVLEFDGNVVYQSNTICRYLGKQLGMAGDNDCEAAQMDAIADTISDLRFCVVPPLIESDDIVAEEKLKAMKTVEFPNYLEKLDKVVEENGGYFVNKKMSWCDFVLIGISDYLNHFAGEDVINKYKNLAQLREKIHSIPAINKYLAGRKPGKFYTREDVKGYAAKAKEAAGK